MVKECSARASSDFLAPSHLWERVTSNIERFAGNYFIIGFVIYFATNPTCLIIMGALELALISNKLERSTENKLHQYYPTIAGCAMIYAFIYAHMLVRIIPPCLILAHASLKARPVAEVAKGKVSKMMGKLDRVAKKAM